MTKLSVNINKLATLRNSRGKNNPDVVRGALDLISFGAEGITVHPRPDQRHIRRQDVFDLKKVVTTVELNIEGYPSDDFVQLIREIRPAQTTLVPDPPEALTSNAGWQVQANLEFLKRASTEIRATGSRVSVFVDPFTMRPDEYGHLKMIGVDRVELYTERFAESFADRAAHPAVFADVLETYASAAESARAAGLGVNAGHDLTSENLELLIARIPWIDEVSIGHALICDALYWGLSRTVQVYLQAIVNGSESARVSGIR